MTTITIDIPENNAEEILTYLKRLGVKIRKSKLSYLDKLNKGDYRKHFTNQNNVTRDRALKYL